MARQQSLTIVDKAKESLNLNSIKLNFDLKSESLSDSLKTAGIYYVATGRASDLLCKTLYQASIAKSSNEDGESWKLEVNPETHTPYSKFPEFALDVIPGLKRSRDGKEIKPATVYAWVTAGRVLTTVPGIEQLGLSPDILNTLGSIKPEQIQAWVENGTIHAGMTQKESRELVKAFKESQGSGDGDGSGNEQHKAVRKWLLQKVYYSGDQMSHTCRKPMHYVSVTDDFSVTVHDFSASFGVAYDDPEDIIPEDETYVVLHPASKKEEYFQYLIYQMPETTQTLNEVGIFSGVMVFMRRETQVEANSREREAALTPEQLAEREAQYRDIYAVYQELSGLRPELRDEIMGNKYPGLWRKAVEYCESAEIVFTESENGGNKE